MVKNSNPIVGFTNALNTPFNARIVKHVFPTPLEPITMTLNIK